MKKKAFVVVGFFLLCMWGSASPKAFCQEDYQITKISDLEPCWTYVASGDVIATPIHTEKGYIFLLDGRMAVHLDSEGQPLWQKAFRTKIKPFCSINRDNLIHIATSTKNISMLNPNGTLIWTKNTGSEVKSKPLCGRDGRLFVQTSKGICCFGTMGKLKWTLDVSSQDYSKPMIELSDGSILIFTLEVLQNGSPKVIRFSPFGDILQSPELKTSVSSVMQTESGLVIAYKNGTLELYQLQDDKLQSQWTLDSKKTNIRGNIQLIQDDKSLYVIHGNLANILKINLCSGEILSKYQSNLVKTDKLIFYGPTNQGFIVADKSNASCFDNEGNPLWTFNYSDKRDWTYLYATDTGNIVFCTKDWIIEAYCIKQYETFADHGNHPTPKREDYSNLYQMDISELGIMDYSVITRETSAGNYGPKEKEFIAYLQNELYLMYNEWTSKYTGTKESTPYFYNDLQYKKEIFGTIRNLESTEFRKNIIPLLKEIEDSSILSLLIRSAGEIGYDADYEILNAFETILQTKTVKKDQELIEAICDATYNICLYMGQDALNEKGKDVISYMFYPQFSSKMQRYARATMSKLAGIN